VHSGVLFSLALAEVAGIAREWIPDRLANIPQFGFRVPGQVPVGD
jgi:hypothetical protein